MHGKSSTHISCCDKMIDVNVSVFATHLADEEMEAWRGLETKVGGSRMPYPWGREVEFWGQDWPASRGRGTPRLWGDSGDPVLSLVLAAPPGSPAWCQGCPLPVTMMPRARTLSQPPPHVSGFCHICAGSYGRWGGGGRLSSSAHAKLCLAAVGHVCRPGPGLSSSAS